MTVQRDWNFSKPPSNVINKPIYLLTISGICIRGYWSGHPGQYFSAWSAI